MWKDIIAEIDIKKSPESMIEEQVAKWPQYKMYMKKLEEKRAAVEAFEKDKPFLTGEELQNATLNLKYKCEEIAWIQIKMDEMKMKLWKKQMSKETKQLIKTPKEYTGMIKQLKEKNKKA